MGAKRFLRIKPSQASLWVAVLMLALTLAPAGIWMHPAVDAVYRGFDPNLVYAGGLAAQAPTAVRVSQHSIELRASPFSEPTVTLVTTSIPRFHVTLDVLVTDNSAADNPIRIGVWTPWAQAGRFIVFGPSPENQISAETVVGGIVGSTLEGGRVVAPTVIGHYSVGNTYHVDITVDKRTGVITNRVWAATETQPDSLVNSASLQAITGGVPVSLTASASPGSGQSSVVLQNYELALPHEVFWADRVVDARVQVAVMTLTVIGLLLVSIAVALWVGEKLPGLGKSRRPPIEPIRPWIAAKSHVFLLVGALAIYFIGNGLLFQLGGHPFDMGGEKLYAYVARIYGPAQLYYVPDLVSLAKIWGGVPYIEAAFPYEPLMAYLATAIGSLNSLFFAAGGVFSPYDVKLEYLIKALNVLFGLADACLIYLILHRLSVNTRWRLVASGLFLFNPAVWFSMSVWGQTHVISIFFVLAAVLMAERQVPTWAWLALAAACLTRPQMLVFGFLLSIVFLRKFSWHQNLTALAWTVIVSFLVLVPFTAVTSPSLPIDIMLNNFRIQQAGGNVVALTTVSQDAYSVWPLVTYLAQGSSGVERAFTPSAELLIGTLSYLRLSQVLTLTALLVTGSALAFRRRAYEADEYLPIIGLGITSFLMLLTGVVSTHFLLALPFLLLIQRRTGSAAYFYLAAIWTVTTFVPMYGDMGSLISSQAYPLLSRAHNGITRFFVALYSWDRFITVSVVANSCAVAWLAVIALRPRPSRAAEVHAP